MDFGSVYIKYFAIIKKMAYFCTIIQANSILIYMIVHDVNFVYCNDVMMMSLSINQHLRLGTPTGSRQCSTLMTVSQSNRESR